MEKIKEHKTTILIVGIILFSVLALTGLTYAWFSATVTGNENAKNNVVETGTLSIVYTNGEEIRVENIVPGWSETKTFTVENTGTAKASYKINWENLLNEFVNKEDLVYTINGDNGRSINESQIPESGEHINIINNISIEPEEVHTYTMTIKYINRDKDQSSDMGKRLIGKLEVEEIGKPEVATAINGAKDIIEKYSEDNAEGIIKIEQPATSQTPELTEYRYSGSNEEVKNYVTFNDEVWRIIGVFSVDDGTGNYEQRIKIVRNESIGTYSWDTSEESINTGYGINQWGESGSYNGADLMRLLNPGYESENINNSLYYNSGRGTCYNGTNNLTTSCNFTSIGLSEEARNMISDAKWYTAAITYSQTTPNAYKNERGTTVGLSDSGISITKTTNWIGKIGLMSPSDYGYGSSSCYASTPLYNSSGTDYRQEACTSNNWLYNGESHWMMSPLSTYSYIALYVYSTGNINTGYVRTNFGVHPVTYLKSNVKITSGTGTSTDPYILSL